MSFVIRSRVMKALNARRQKNIFMAVPSYLTSISNEGFQGIIVFGASLWGFEKRRSVQISQYN